MHSNPLRIFLHGFGIIFEEIVCYLLTFFPEDNIERTGAGKCGAKEKTGEFRSIPEIVFGCFRENKRLIKAPRKKISFQYLTKSPKTMIFFKPVLCP